MVPKNVIPTGWTRCCVGDIATVATGGTPSRKNPSYWGGDVPWVTTGEIDFNTICSTSECITELGVKNSSAKIFPSGTLLMAMFGQGVTRGRVALLGIDAAFNQACSAITVTNGDLPKFLFHFLQHHYRQIRCLGQAGTQANLNASIIREIPLLRPPQPSQDYITGVADTADETIDLLTAIIHAKQRLKRGLMQQLLTGKRRFPEFGDEPWEEFHLGDLFDERNETKFEELPLLSITANSGIIYRDEVDKKDSSNSDKGKYKRIIPGDIGYNTMRMWQGVSALSSLEGIVSPAYTICIPGPQIDGDFAKHLFKFPPVVHRFYRHSQGLVSDTWNLKFHNFAQVKVTVPCVEEQRRIAAVFDSLDQDIALLTQQQAALQKQKKGLMQQLLTGKVRVPVANESAEVTS